MKHFKKHSGLLILGLLLLIFNSCRDISNNPKYQRPDWLSGKLYTTVSSEDNLTIFAQMLEKTIWSDILDRSGFYTVFAPTDEAFQKFFEQSPDYNSIEDFDSLTLDNIIRYHIIEDGWSNDQLKRLTINGFIDEDSKIYDEPRAFKRKTLYRDQIKTMYVVSGTEDFPDKITRSVQSSYRKVVPDTKKYVPLFFKEYLNIYDYTGADYEFYFDRPFIDGEIYYGNALVGENELFAENGFVHPIDQVVLPLPNLEQVLLEKDGSHEFTDFIDLIYEFPYFAYNETETKKQSGYAEGETVDKLYDVYYPAFGVDIDEEETGLVLGNINTSLMMHPTMVAPTNVAFQKLVNNVLTKKSGYPHYNSYYDVPDEVKFIIVNSAMSRAITYEHEFTEGFRNLENDSIILSIDEAVTRKFCSNGVFVGVNEPVVPRAFTSVAGPIWLRPGYSVFREGMLRAGLMSEIKKRDGEYTLFAINDGNLSLDSSMIVEERDVGGRTREYLIGFDRSEDPPAKFEWNGSTLSTAMMNQICIGVAEGIAKYEFLPTLSGDFVMLNNEDNYVQGSSGSVFGIGGDSAIDVVPTLFEEPTDNGVAYEVNGWFSFGASSSLFSKVREIGRSGDQLENYFIQLCKRVGFADDNGFLSNFISPNDYYTVFVPGDKALQDYEDLENVKLDQMDIDELKKFLQYHFVRGDLIFTDGKKPSKEYQTLRVDETSTDIYKVYSKLKLNIDYDLIQAVDNEGSVVFEVEPEQRNSNIITYTRIIDPDDAENTTIFATGIVHEISNVLRYGN